MDKDKCAIDGDLADSVAMLEQILEVMPQDLVALKALYNAYCQCGHREQAFEYLGTLADIACNSNDAETAEFIVEQLPDFREMFPSEVALQLERIQTEVGFGGPTAAAASEANPASATEAESGEELALAWKLFEENQLSQEEYSSVLHDLTEVSSKEVDVPVSVLHVLNDRGFKQINRIINHMSARSGVPCISLLNFELPEQMAEVLPLEFSARDGALPFSFFGNDLLVAVLNPFSHVLIDKVEKTSGHRCHTYLVSADQYDIALGKLRGMAA
jgi:tetratricopeptide (TPR) repeat protein